MGPDALRRRGVARLSYPMERGMITDWEKMDLVWRRAFHGAHLSLKRRTVLISEVPFASQKQRRVHPSLLGSPDHLLSVAPS